jgi:hypothetical protein
MKRESGMQEDAILDLRGNHDAFNMPQRCASQKAQHPG